MAENVDTKETEPVLPREIEGALFAGLRPEPVAAERAARIRNKIDAALDAAEVAMTRRLDDGPWLRRSPHFEIKILNYDQASGQHSYVLRLAANGIIETHAHSLPEECMILSGEIEVDGLTLGAGDYQVFQPGTRHGRIFSRNGALLFVRAELDLVS